MLKGLSAVFVIIIVALLSTTTALSYKHFTAKKQKPLTNVNNGSQEDCAGLAKILPEEMDWSVYEDHENKFKIKYPSALYLEKKDNGFVLKTNKDERGNIIWFYVYPRPENKDILNLWTENPPNDHADELVSANYNERVKNANLLLKNSETVSVGMGNIKGYKLNIADVLEREEVFWQDANNIYNLGYSPQNISYGCIGGKRWQIVNHMLRFNFEQVKTLEEITINWKPHNEPRFSFKQPEHFYIADNKNEIIEWRSTFGDFFMVLKSSNKPLTDPEIDQEFTLSNNNKIKVLYINENKQIEIDGKTVQWFSFGCLADCNFHMASFNVNDKYYQLIFDVAGGGLSDTFNKILQTLTFTNQ